VALEHALHATLNIEGPRMIGFDLTGKTALVTGASGGLGAQFARALATAGADIIIGARRREASEGVAQGIRAQGGLCTTIDLDVACSASIAQAWAALERVDVLVNNAGIGRPALALHQAESDWDAVLDTNLKGVFLMAQACARAMRQRGTGGSIINITSILGVRQAPATVSYAAAKAGVIQLTRTLALEWARYGIRVNALAPGYFDNEINAEFFESEAGKAMLERIPQHRLGRLDELDGPLLLLASDMSSFMTGTVIEVDGGHLVSAL
jgi:NAD(P)-dependent dehydrogenase (short-subunit alcohol dehydrogenase family)